MPVTLQLSSELLERTRAHLLRRTRHEDEQVAFFFSDPYGGDRVLRLTDVYFVPPEQFIFQSGFHVRLSDEVRQYLIRRAWDSNACLVEAHSHPGPGAVDFSPSDLAGFEEWVPHLRWRLKRRPYAALVFGYESFDALAWIDGADQPESVERLSVAGGLDEFPTGTTIAELQSAPARRTSRARD
jgi:Prokaryotic homologs of the JAB domain